MVEKNIVHPHATFIHTLLWLIHMPQSGCGFFFKISIPSFFSFSLLNLQRKRKEENEAVVHAKNLTTASNKKETRALHPPNCDLHISNF